MKYALLLGLALAWATPAIAQHSHGQKGPNGGQMEDVAGVHAELVASGNTIVIHISDEANKPVATTGFSASALIVNGSERETLALVPSGASALKGELKKPAVKGAAITITLRTSGGKSGQAKFKL